MKLLKLIFVLSFIGLGLAGCSEESEQEKASTTIPKVEDQVKDEQSKEDTVAKERAEKDRAEQEQAEKIAQQEAEQQKQNEAAAAEAHTQSLGLVEATITRVVDGDTVVLADGEKVRLIGINTPESTNRIEEYGKEASDYTTAKLTNKKVWLQKDVSERDRYNRLLRIIWLDIPKDDLDENEIRTKMFNAELVLNGYAEPSTYPPDVKYSEYFLTFAREARENNTGLWAFGEYGTTKGDFDPKGTPSTQKNQSNTDTSTNASTSPSTSGQSEFFKNCTELRKVYPKGVPSDHPAYQAKMDRDKDGWACER